jgi:hypothetical protein
MKYSGKYGEYLVLLNLLKRNFEAYLAIKANQDDYDITVILNASCVRRIQVKTTEVQNNGTNNVHSGTGKEYDYLILVMVDNGNDRIFVLTKEEATKERGTSKLFGTTQIKSKISYIKDSLIKYEDRWDKIKAPVNIDGQKQKQAGGSNEPT